MLRPLPLLALAALVGTALVGCEDTVDPTLGLDVPFSLYGYLDPTADRQAIRVVPIQDRIDAPTDTIDATVTSTDLASGETTAWRDSVVTYGDGQVGHVFVAELSPRPGTTVRVEARRSDGVASTVDVIVPPIVQADLAAARTGGGEVTYPIEFEGAPRVLSGLYRLFVTNLPGRDSTETAELTVRLPPPTETAPDLWTVDVPFVSSARAALDREGWLGTGARLIGVTYVGFVANEAWDPPSDDPDALVEPGTFSNVEGGLGFLGAGYSTSIGWTPSPEIQRLAGFDVPGDEGLPSAVINEVVPGPGGWVELYNPFQTAVDLRGYSLSDSQADPRRQPILSGVVPPEGFLVIDLAFVLTNFESATIKLYDRSRLPVSSLTTDVVGEIGMSGDLWAYGSWPDGLSFRLPQGGPDIYRGPLLPTPGEPNELGLPLGSINEVYTGGADGFAEVRLFQASAPRVFDAPDGFFDAVPALGTPLAVAGERPGTFTLSQGGGSLFLVVDVTDPRAYEGDLDAGYSTFATTRVVDVRAYGGQTVGRSSGYLPDAPDGTWTTGLRPTRGAPNAAARLGL